MAQAPRYLRNCWYVAAHLDELENRDLLARTLLEEPVVLLKTETGRWHALADRCPHRFAPLSMGSCDKGIVVCAYHGLAFDGAGNCVHNPHGPVTGSLAVKSYPLALRGPLVWIWMGDPALAETTPAPSYEWLENGSHHIGLGYLYGLANYQLMADNILDLSHIEYLHPILGTEAVSKAKVEVETTPDSIVTTRHMVDELLSEPLARTYRAEGARVDRELRVEWRAPSLMELTVTICPQSPPGAPPRGSRTLHLFTPETSGSTHYFYVSGMSKSDTSEQIASGFRAALEKAFVHEDKPMIDAQQRRIGPECDIMDMGPAMLSIDKAPVLARRRLRQRIDNERIFRDG